MSGHEELYETLIDLENERVLSKKINQESENLLKGLKILVDRFNEEDILGEVISVLRDIIGCEDIIVMTENEHHYLITQAATSTFYYNIELEPHEFFKRIIKGDISISFDIQSIQEWQSKSNELNKRLKSTIHIGLGYNERDTILVCCDSRSHYFDRSHADLIKRYSTLVTQALINIDYQEKINTLNKHLIDAARQAGMAEVAGSVLHSMGNVLNSLNISSEILQQKINSMSTTKISKLADLLNKNNGKEGNYFTETESGRDIVKYISLIAKETEIEKLNLLQEVQSMSTHINHLKNTVSLQQTISKPTIVITRVFISKIITDILSIYKTQIENNAITVSYEHDGDHSLMNDQYQIERILQNLIHNAIESLKSSEISDKSLVVSCQLGKDKSIIIQVIDNGLGISPNRINKIFNFKSTTKKGGHGFGLHYSALEAKRLGGELTAASKGLGQGATFTLKLVSLSE